MPRRTRSQTHILKVITTLGTPISAQDLYRQLRDHQYRIGLATVYRALEALKLEGAVQMRTLPTGESVYSVPKEDRHHLTCLQCDRTIPVDECPVHDLEKTLHRTHQFRIFYHTLEFFGLCPDCQSPDLTNVATADHCDP
ncbi:MAG: transcriptional repressor [Leptolyngbya sp. RL_3_1]|nr:transcriptional repressor [Leptolyngbya sp. RL_3_1]